MKRKNCLFKSTKSSAQQPETTGTTPALCKARGCISTLNKAKYQQKIVKLLQDPAKFARQLVNLDVNILY